jgi:hypothetical protein
MVITIRLILAAAAVAAIVGPNASAKGHLPSSSFTTASAAQDSARAPRPANAKKPGPCRGHHCLWQHQH